MPDARQTPDERLLARVRAAIEASDLPRGELARRAELSPRTVHRLMSGQTWSMPTLERLAEVLKVEIDTEEHDAAVLRAQVRGEVGRAQAEAEAETREAVEGAVTGALAQALEVAGAAIRGQVAPTDRHGRTSVHNDARRITSCRPVTNWIEASALLGVHRNTLYVRRRFVGDTSRAWWRDAEALYRWHEQLMQRVEERMTATRDGGGG